MAKLEEGDWISGNITEKERAVVEAIMAMPRYINEDTGSSIVFLKRQKEGLT